jgi:hypothetical protein
LAAGQDIRRHGSANLDDGIQSMNQSAIGVSLQVSPILFF